MGKPENTTIRRSPCTRNEYVNEEALAYELAADFILPEDNSDLAHYYLRDAHYAYVRWGALAKVKDLEIDILSFLLTWP